MKTSELLEGMWVAKSLDGVERRFKNLADSEAWKTVTAKKPKGPVDKHLKAARAAYPNVDASIALAWYKEDHGIDQPEGKSNRPTNSEIFAKVEEAVGNSEFPHGDPMSHLADWARKHDLDMDDIDAAVIEKCGFKVTGFNDYLAQMWDDSARDAERDAMMGAYGDNYDGQWFTHGNPWR